MVGAAFAVFNYLAGFDFAGIMAEYFHFSPHHMVSMCSLRLLEQC